MRLSLSSTRAPIALTLITVLLALVPAADTLRLASTPTSTLHPAHPLKESLQQLAQLTQQQRLLVARGFQMQTGHAGDDLTRLRQAGEVSLTQARQSSGLMSAEALAEFQAIEAEWTLLDADLAQGKLSAALSFARHTQLLDRQIALQSRLTGQR